jgi:hypothetical protein
MFSIIISIQNVVYYDLFQINIKHYNSTYRKFYNEFTKIYEYSLCHKTKSNFKISIDRIRLLLKQYKIYSNHYERYAIDNYSSIWNPFVLNNIDTDELIEKLISIKNLIHIEINSCQKKISRSNLRVRSYSM